MKKPLSFDDKNRKKIAESNHKYARKHKELINLHTETVLEKDHINIESYLGMPPHQNTIIKVCRYSTIETAIYYHNKYKCLKICALNFADSTRPGGGYLNGRSPQEETLCRQTLLYPTLVSSPYMYKYNIENNKTIEGSDIMIYSPDVYVIRDDKYNFLDNSKIFPINIISSPAIDNRKKVQNSNHLMEERIRKIIKLAAYKNSDILILGAFGCGIFSNDPSKIADIFYKVLVLENMKNYFQYVIFPIVKSEKNYHIFKWILNQQCA